MNELISFAFAGSNATSIRVFIDIYSIKNTLLGRDFSYENDNDLCALILDMCVHYKNYFYGLGVTPIFYLIDSNNLPANAKTLYPAYNQGFAMKLTSGNAGFIEKNMEYLSILCPYLPNIRYIKTSFESSVVIADIALKIPLRVLAMPQPIINFWFLYKTRRLITGRIQVNAMGEAVVQKTKV